jgi:hypothetical protein
MRERASTNSSRPLHGLPRPRMRRAAPTGNEANASYGDRIIRLRDGWLVDE